ncbi:MAG TPA: hypothetical protein VK787_01165 [Puia sp.]|jgi:hypothetical protein|nr:hypothetical protein [Puia sp.]
MHKLQTFFFTLIIFAVEFLRGQKTIMVMNADRHPVPSVITLIKNTGVGMVVLGPVAADGKMILTSCENGCKIRVEPQNADVYYRYENFCNFLKNPDTIWLPRKEDIARLNTLATKLYARGDYKSSAFIYGKLVDLYKNNDSNQRSNQSMISFYSTYGKSLNLNDSYKIVKDSFALIQPSELFVELINSRRVDKIGSEALTYYGSISDSTFKEAVLDRIYSKTDFEKVKKKIAEQSALSLKEKINMSLITN